MSALMDIIHDCENRLGWAPVLNGPIWRIRAAEHRKLMRAMERRHYEVGDLRLALNYCIRRRQPISSPMELIGLVDEARNHAIPDTPTNTLTARRDAAIAWEQEHPDENTSYWVGRLVRSLGMARADTLTEWGLAGRGWSNG